jgi:alkylglycerol monooxygenase
MAEIRSIFFYLFVSVTLYGLAETANVFTPIVCAVLKALPALFCAMGSFRCLTKALRSEKIRQNAAIRYCTLVIFGLIFCAGGDLMLRLDKESVDQKCFLLGLISFLLGHLLFICAFWFDGGNGVQLKWGTLIYTYMAVYVFYILTKIPEEDYILRTGVVSYCLIIGTMCHRSISLSVDAYPRVQSTLYAMYGSIFFILSDSLLAYNRFISPIPFDFVWVLGTYFVAVALIASSCDGSSRWAAGWQ